MVNPTRPAPVDLDALHKSIFKESVSLHDKGMLAFIALPSLSAELRALRRKVEIAGQCADCRIALQMLDEQEKSHAD